MITQILFWSSLQNLIAVMFFFNYDDAIKSAKPLMALHAIKTDLLYSNSLKILEVLSLFSLSPPLLISLPQAEH
jgi:hypothetical protein